MDGVSLRCVCGHDEHIGPCGCGCTIFEEDRDEHVDWFDASSAFRWQPESLAYQ
jgi:hypothetical protein